MESGEGSCTYRAFSQQCELLNQFQEAESAGDVGKLTFCVRSLIVQAASDTTVGMTSLAKCEKKRKAYASQVQLRALRK
eukprot:78384-Pelagomonas_calceolata.AAC.1